MTAGVEMKFLWILRESKKGCPRSGIEVKYYKLQRSEREKKSPYVMYVYGDRTQKGASYNEMPLFIAFNFIQQKASNNFSFI